jgi:hypothetical protein
MYLFDDFFFQIDPTFWNFCQFCFQIDPTFCNFHPMFLKSTRLFGIFTNFFDQIVTSFCNFRQFLLSKKLFVGRRGGGDRAGRVRGYGREGRGRGAGHADGEHGRKGNRRRRAHGHQVTILVTSEQAVVFKTQTIFCFWKSFKLKIVEDLENMQHKNQSVFVTLQC